jgi:hypothetical protein
MMVCAAQALSFPDNFLLGNAACNFKKIPTLTQDLSMEMHRYERGSVSMYPRRPLAEASHDAFDVVELASRPLIEYRTYDTSKFYTRAAQ